jgi:hypothetical protein
MYIWNLILLFGDTLPPHWPVFTFFGGYNLIVYVLISQYMNVKWIKMN